MAETKEPIAGPAAGPPLPSSSWEMDGALFVFRWLYRVRECEEEMRPLLCPSLSGCLGWKICLCLAMAGMEEKPVVRHRSRADEARVSDPSSDGLNYSLHELLGPYFFSFLPWGLL